MSTVPLVLLLCFIEQSDIFIRSTAHSHMVQKHIRQGAIFCIILSLADLVGVPIVIYATSVHATSRHADVCEL